MLGAGSDEVERRLRFVLRRRPPEMDLLEVLGYQSDGDLAVPGKATNVHREEEKLPLFRGPTHLQGEEAREQELIVAPGHRRFTGRGDLADRSRGLTFDFAKPALDILGARPSR